MNYNTNNSLFSFFSSHMRHTLCFLFLSILATSCRQKDKSAAPAKCEGYFVSIFDARSTMGSLLICLTNSENNYGLYNATKVNSSSGELNWRNRRFYNMSTYKDKTEFRYTNLDILKYNTMGEYVLDDTSKHAPVYRSLICNTLSDIVYCFAKQSDSCKLYEVSRNGIFNVHLIGVYDSGYNTRTAAVDETSGNIFAMQGNTLKKIDPNNGNESEVATYTYSQPIKLYYNNNDKMFYAVDRVGQYRLLRINPADGVLNVQGIIEGMDSLNFYQITFDRCNNQLIHVRYQNPPSTFYLDAYWINLKDASIASSLPNIWSGNVIGYINGKFPQNN